MPRISDIFIVETPAQRALAISAVVAESGIPAFVGDGFARLGQHIASMGGAAADTPFLRIVADDPRALQVVVGTAVSGTVKSAGDIADFLIPAGKKLLCYYQGDNSLMGPVYDELQDFANKRGFAPGRDVFEYYLNGMEFGQDRLLTKIVIPLESV